MWIITCESHQIDSAYTFGHWKWKWQACFNTTIHHCMWSIHIMLVVMITLWNATILHLYLYLLSAAANSSFWILGVSVMYNKLCCQTLYMIYMYIACMMLCNQGHLQASSLLLPGSQRDMRERVRTSWPVRGQPQLESWFLSWLSSFRGWRKKFFRSSGCAPFAVAVADARV